MPARSPLDRSAPRFLAAALFASLAFSGCDAGEPATTPTPATGSAAVPGSGGGVGAAPDIDSLRVGAPDDEVPEIDSSLQAPNPREIAELQGVVWTRELPGESGRPDPSLERLEQFSEWKDVSVEFYEERYPGGNLRLQGHRTTPVQGDAVAHGPEWRWFENGQLERRREFWLGKASGPFEEWRESGIKKAEGRLDADLPVGRWVRWSALGGVWKVRSYTRGKLDGIEYVFLPDGSLNQRSGWAGGKKDGEEFVWSKRGAPLEQNGWKNGKRDGLRRQWYGQGRLALDTIFVDGKRDGPFSQYWKSGDPHLLGQFSMGGRIGEWRQWSETGQLTSVEHYADGVFEGLVQRWNADGLLVFEAGFVAGKGDGAHREFYDGGGPKSEQVYVDGLPEGLKTTWHPSGVKASEGEMKAGQRHGEWTLWGEDGAVLEAWSGRYENDEKVPE